MERNVTAGPEQMTPVTDKVISFTPTHICLYQLPQSGVLKNQIL